MTIFSLCEEACKRDYQIADYLGPKSKWHLEHNRKLQIMLDMLLNHSNIKQTNSKPIVLRWLFDRSDTSDMDDGLSELQD